MSEHFDVRLDELLRKCESGNPHGEIFEPNPIQVGFKRLNENASLPTKAHATDSGFDLYAAEDVIIEPGETVVIKTGIAVQLPKGYEAQVRPRSGVTSRTKLRVQLGTIDNGYNGEIGVIVDNVAQKEYWTEDFSFSVEVTEDYELLDGSSKGSGYFQKWASYQPKGTYLIRKGDKLAQLVVQPLPSVEAYEISGELGETERGTGGFGSTGVREGE